ncbi:hypothetical protein NQ315_004052 [Exocentrus adspersus]|uniref:Intimal thickness related receptor IRP domain-containing protein n=1 Tax=Exocentrus adspersus TaxID=1586481 RepID=A0AAV8W635_9CUCU|nr:hypothetical protein NQ315_004052 [Exocentrus adspersus]
MKVKLGEIHFIIVLSLITNWVSAIHVHFSEKYIKTEVNKWSNVTVHIESTDNAYTSGNVILEVNHTSHVKVSPKFIEIHFNNFSSWCHMFHVYALKPGISKILFHFGNSSLGTSLGNLTIDVDVVQMKALEPYAEWCRKYYYIFTVISAYPQIVLQFLRLSVVGLDMDYVCFNFIGHLSYGTYTLFMYTKMGTYTEKDQFADFPATLSENMYALHGLIFSILLGIQAIKYYGFDKGVTVIGKELISFYGIVFTFGFLLAKFDVIRYLDFLCICKYIHVASTSTKYAPQIYKIYVIKSTFGWNIWNSNLELVGCVAVISNIMLTSYNYDNWTSGIVTNALFWMACAIALQHLVFVAQHYFVYRKRPEFDLNDLQEFTLEEKITLYEERLLDYQK